MDTEWKSFVDELPTMSVGEIAVYSRITGRISTASVVYGRVAAKENGWTHWLALPDVPLEEEIDTIESLRKENEALKEHVKNLEQRLKKLQQQNIDGRKF